MNVDPREVKIRPVCEPSARRANALEEEENPGLTFDDVFQSVRAAIWLGLTTPLALLLVLRPGDASGEIYPVAAIASGSVAFVLSLFVRATEASRDDVIGVLRATAYLVLGVQFACFLGAMGYYFFNK